ncbi:MAG: class I SAM-dependent methyltransferase [Betaproteobacteria bacterium]|nr:class I SAM-dependent methyltransferase [Betaproteobacteria bacterium]
MQRRSALRMLGGLAALPLGLAAPALRAFEAERPVTDNMAGPYVPTPWVILDEMIKLADIKPTDTLYDLGSGDGRLVIAAAKRHGARGVGVEYQAKLVEYSRVQARREGVAQRVRFVQGDLFRSDLGPASVVTLYLLPRFVERLVPKLRAELAPGSRVVSHDYALNPWPAEKTLIFDVEEAEHQRHHQDHPVLLRGAGTRRRALEPADPGGLAARGHPVHAAAGARRAGRAVARAGRLRAGAARPQCARRGGALRNAARRAPDVLQGHGEG